MCSCRQARQNALLSKEQRPGTDSHKCAFFLGVFLLQVGESFDEAKWFSLGFEDGVDGAARDDEDIVASERFVGLRVVDMCAEGGARVGGCVFSGGDEVDLEGFGCWRAECYFDVEGGKQRKECGLSNIESKKKECLWIEIESH